MRNGRGVAFPNMLLLLFMFESLSLEVLFGVLCKPVAELICDPVFC